MSHLRLRRSRHLLFSCQDGQIPDISALLRGVVELVPTQQLYAISLLDGKEHPIGREDLLLLLSVPSDRWISSEELTTSGGVDVDTLQRFARDGLLLCEDPDEPFRTLRTRDESLLATPWNFYAAIYHIMHRWKGVRIDLDEAVHGSATIDDLVERHGPSPPHFHSVGGNVSCALPDGRREGDVYRTLIKRRTTRSLFREAELQAEDLSTILRYVFGCHGFDAIRGDTWLLQKTSPSGGAMHPIEVYLLLRRVHGFQPGLYHYSVERHELETMQTMEESEVEDLAILCAAGQSYVRDAQALFLLTARFPRSFWKYRRHEKAYGVVLMDAGHLSQTFYLVCTDLALGAFVTAAINEVDVEEALGIDGIAEGAVAMLGCGLPGPRDPSLDPVFTPFTPGESRR